MTSMRIGSNKGSLLLTEGVRGYSNAFIRRYSLPRRIGIAKRPERIGLHNKRTHHSSAVRIFNWAG